MCLYVNTIRSLREGADRRPGRPEDPGGLTRCPKDPGECTGQLEDLENQGRL